VSARIYDVVHSMMQRLRPSVLDDLGLVAALQDEIDAWRSRHANIECQFTTTGKLSGLGEAINITVYRIVQESLTNITKHAASNRVIIKLVRDESVEDGGPYVRLSISDNGRGTNPDMRGRGLGLIGMRERIEALGGCFTIHSSPGEGMRIEASIPLTNRETVV